MAMNVIVKENSTTIKKKGGSACDRIIAGPIYIYIYICN